jgi:Holliday junction resolvase
VTREAGPTATIQRRLRERGAWCAKLHADGTGRNGLPDLIACYRGQLLAIEVKRPGASGTLRALQRVELDRVARAGGTPIVATSWLDVALELARIDAGITLLSKIGAQLAETAEADEGEP